MTEPGLAPATPSPQPGPASRRRVPADETSPHVGRPATSGQPRVVVAERPRSRGGLLLVFALFWLAATMWGAHASIIRNRADPAVALSALAIVLPVVIAASLLAGAAAALVIAGRFAAGRGTLVRLGLGLAAGIGCGAGAAAVILATYGANPSVGQLALTMAVAAAVGGCGAALPLRLLGAGLGATLAAFAISVVINYFQSPLIDLFASGATMASWARAVQIFAYAQSTLAGVVAGAVAYMVVRRGGGARSWPGYLLAGATTGLVLLLADLLTRLGGTSVVSFVRSLSPADQAAMSYGESARLRNALVVGFVGGIVAMIAYGRTLRPADDTPADNVPADNVPADNAPADDAPADDAPADAPTTPADPAR